MGFTTASCIMESRKDNIRISTGCKDLDNILEGRRFCSALLLEKYQSIHKQLTSIQEALRPVPLLRCMASSDVGKHSCATPFVFYVRYP